MFLQRGFRRLKKKICIRHSKESYGRLRETPEDQKEDSQHHHYHQLRVPKGFVPIIVGEIEGKQGKTYMIQVEYLSSPTFISLIDKLWKEQEAVLELDLEDKNEGPMKLPCTPTAFEQVLEACYEEYCCKDPKRSRRFPKFCHQ